MAYYIFIPKRPILVYFERPRKRNFRCISWPFGISLPFWCTHFVAVLVLLWPFRYIFFPFWFVVPMYHEKSGNPAYLPTSHRIILPLFFSVEAKLKVKKAAWRSDHCVRLENRRSGFESHQGIRK
jgi:hypothetical protein